MTAALDQTRTQLQDVTTKLNQLSEAQQAAEAARATQRAAASQHRGTARVRRDDPRWKQVQDELAAHQKAIDATQTDLASAKTELSGSIARSHDELVALAKKGERNYYEFDLNKSKQFTRTGPIGISLRKANSKHDFADLALLVDVYHEFSEPQKMLHGIRQALKARGRLVLLEYRKEDPAVPIRPEHKMSIAGAKKEVEAEGYVLEKVDERLPWQHILIFR